MSGIEPLARHQHVLALADDALVASQRLGWWISRTPLLEEDVAVANIGLDLLGQARALLAHAGRLEGRDRGEDDLAYFRDEREFRNVCLVERAQPDFAVVMVRMLLLAAWQRALYAALVDGEDRQLGAIAGKAVKEVAYHLEHAAGWVVRLGDGTEESHLRTQRALEEEWRWFPELFDASWLDPGLVADGTAPDPGSLRASVEATVTDVLRQAKLTVPSGPPALARGRHGLHTEQMGYLLAEMQYLARSHPGATW